jgi:hypothetical protein
MQHCEDCNVVMPAHNSAELFKRYQSKCQQCRLIEAIELVADELRRTREGY